jgi:hypothetical protein
MRFSRFSSASIYLAKKGPHLTLAGEILLFLFIPEKYATTRADVTQWLFAIGPPHLAACPA